MNPNLKAKTLKMAIASLPDPNSYPVDIITIAVGENRVKFQENKQRMVF